MKHDFKIFIGWDFSQSEAAEICAASIKRFTQNEVPISFIQRDVLSLRGLHWRPLDPGQSTAFAFTRFLTPYLAGFYGTALFCDSDFFWRKDPREILAHQDNRCPVQVVRHQLRSNQIQPTKMNGHPQKWYPKKNWSSLMMFNMNDQRNLADLIQLNPYNVSERSAAWLHQFEWYPEISLGSGIPTSFNHLVGYGYPDTDPHAVHFTDGGPWLAKEYEQVEFADEWMALRKELATQDLRRV